MKYLNDLKSGDIVYCIDKYDVSKIYEFKVKDIIDNHLIIETEHGDQSTILNPHNKCSTSTLFFMIDNKKYNYFIGTKKYDVINEYKIQLIQSRRYYENILNELKMKVRKNENDLNKCIEDILTIEKLKNDYLEEW